MRSINIDFKYLLIHDINDYFVCFQELKRHST